MRPRAVEVAPSAARPAPKGRHISRSADARMTSKVPNLRRPPPSNYCQGVGDTWEGHTVGEKGLFDMSTNSVILVSNRGPVQYGREGGERTATRGAGGLVTALSSLGQHLQDAVWVCAAMSDEDVVVAKESPGGLFPPELGDDDLRVRLVALD